METADIFLALLFGCIGFGYFMYGRILYPYLASSAWEMVAVGVGLMIVPRFIEL